MKDLKVIVRCDVQEDYLALKDSILSFTNHYLEKGVALTRFVNYTNNGIPDNVNIKVFYFTIVYFLDRYCHVEFVDRSLPFEASEVMSLSADYLTRSMHYCDTYMPFFRTLFSSGVYWQKWPDNPIDIKLKPNLYLDITGKFDL